MCRRNFVTEIYQSCKQFRLAFPISYLTPILSKILYALRQLKSIHPTTNKSSRSHLSNFFAFVDLLPSVSGGNGPNRRARDQRYSINTKEDLEMFASNVSNASLDVVNIIWRI